MSEQAAPRLLMVEDDPDTASLIREMLRDHFKSDQIIHVKRIADALAVDLTGIDLAMSDINLPDGSGLELLEAMRKRREDLPVVMITSEAGLDTAMEAIRKGAYDYVVKIGDYLFAIPLIIEKNLEVWRTKRENLRLEMELKQTLEDLRIKNQQLVEAVGKLETLASTDPLTGLANRRHIQKSLERSFAEASRYGTDLACIMIDLDGFKPLNDTLGHQMGDKLLKTTARVLHANCRTSDIAGRYGGDEFVVLMPHTAPDVAQQAAKRIQQEFVGVIRSILPEDVRCNMSIGLASLSLTHPANADQLVAQADSALYSAKKEGKGRIFVYAPESAAAPAPAPGPGPGGEAQVAHEGAVHEGE